MPCFNHCSSKSSTVNIFRLFELNDDDFVFIDVVGSTCGCGCFFSPANARKNVGIERLVSVSDFRENLPIDVI